jgi:hypothetical protein
LLSLQAEHADWFAALPKSRQNSPTADALAIIVDLDLTNLTDIDLSRGYGRH